MDRIAPQVGRPVVLQAGTYAFTPRNCEYFDFSDDLDGYLDRAWLVVTHGGYTLLELIKARRQFLVFPRLAAHGEHSNDHQLEFALKLREQLNLDYPVVTDAGKLLEAIAAFRPIAYGNLRATLPELQAHLQGFLEGVRRAGVGP